MMLSQMRNCIECTRGDQSSSSKCRAVNSLEPGFGMTRAVPASRGLKQNSHLLREASGAEMGRPWNRESTSRWSRAGKSGGIQTLPHAFLPAQNQVSWKVLQLLSLRWDRASPPESGRSLRVCSLQHSHCECSLTLCDARLSDADSGLKEGQIQRVGSPLLQQCHSQARRTSAPCKSSSPLHSFCCSRAVPGGSKTPPARFSLHPGGQRSPMWPL